MDTALVTGSAGLIGAEADEKMSVDHTEQNVVYDHNWWMGDVREFQAHYPRWSYKYDLSSMLREIYDSLAARSGNVARLAG